ncbi:hypothetical protein CKO_04267 [Citrobacter koseri ATCC BAA-895]|uniref:Uncharacterized protein n=1 Tax=Citrobacter koseri (strain ATCC BAA-895 / CDC 4225-83 / SGSC4696) TaxID=290338 RepID=A8APB2_CITK8|nr:hypothetical protein CKO_04267 [Citrobacter koseri ATCC BAA-895]
MNRDCLWLNCPVALTLTGPTRAKTNTQNHSRCRTAATQRTPRSLPK